MRVSHRRVRMGSGAGQVRREDRCCRRPGTRGWRRLRRCWRVGLSITSGGVLRAVPAMGVDDLGSGMAGDRRVMADDLLAQMARGQGRSETVAPAEYRSSANAAYDAQNGVAAAVPQVVFETQVRPMNGIASGDVMRSSDMPRFEAGPVVVGPVPRSGLLGDGPAMPSGTIAGPTVGAEALHAVLLMAAAASGTDGPAMGAQASVAAVAGSSADASGVSGARRGRGAAPRRAGRGTNARCGFRPTCPLCQARGRRCRSLASWGLRRCATLHRAGPMM